MAIRLCQQRSSASAKKQRAIVQRSRRSRRAVAGALRSRRRRLSAAPCAKRPGKMPVAHPSVRPAFDASSMPRALSTLRRLRVVGSEQTHSRGDRTAGQGAAHTLDLRLVVRPLAIEAVERAAPDARGQPDIAFHLGGRHLLERHEVHEQVGMGRAERLPLDRWGRTRSRRLPTDRRSARPRARTGSWRRGTQSRDRSPRTGTVRGSRR